MHRQDLIAFAQELDDCWLSRRFEDLSGYFAQDAIVVAPSGRAIGVEAVIESYREFMGRTEVRAYAVSGFAVAERGDAAIVEYDCAMDWTNDDQPHSETGREILALFRRDGCWRVFWRTHLSSRHPPSFEGATQQAFGSGRTVEGLKPAVPAFEQDLAKPSDSVG